MKKLYVPRGVFQGKTYLEGYGKKEMLQSLLLMAAFSPFWLILGIAMHFNYIAVITAIGLIMLSFSLTVKVEQVSAFETLRQIWKFYKGQKKYPYKGYLTGKEKV